MSVCGKYLQGNYRIQAVKAQCEIRALEKQLLLAHMRADLETEESVSSSLWSVDILMIQKRCQTMEEVKKLRKEISELKIKISTITKGVPFSRIDVSGIILGWKLLFRIIGDIYVFQVRPGSQKKPGEQEVSHVQLLGQVSDHQKLVSFLFFS